MKKIIAVVMLILFVAALGSTANAASCGAQYMKDPCSLDGYSIVQTERFVRGGHNWMHDIHHFGEKRKTLRKKRILRKKRVPHKRHYRYVKRCRTVKVRI